MLIELLMALTSVVGPQLLGPPDGTQPENLPAGISRTAKGGLTISTLPSYEPALAAAADITKKLSISSLQFGDEGRLRGFTARYQGEQPLPINSVFKASSVTVDKNGILQGVTFAEDTGCDMVVTIEGNTVTYDCVITTCTTACDTVLSGPSGGPYIIKCKCRDEPK